MNNIFVIVSKVPSILEINHIDPLFKCWLATEDVAFVVVAQYDNFKNRFARENKIWIH